MEDLLLSRQQYDVITGKLEKIDGKLITQQLLASEQKYYLDKQEVMKLLKISNRTLQRWRKMGQLPFTRIGNKIYYQPKDLVKRIRIAPESTESPPAPPPPMPEDDTGLTELACQKCPLMMLLTS